MSGNNAREMRYSICCRDELLMRLWADETGVVDYWLLGRIKDVGKKSYFHIRLV